MSENNTGLKILSNPVEIEKGIKLISEGEKCHYLAGITTQNTHKLGLLLSVTSVAQW